MTSMEEAGHPVTRNPDTWEVEGPLCLKDGPRGGWAGPTESTALVHCLSGPAGLSVPGTITQWGEFSRRSSGIWG